MSNKINSVILSLLVLVTNIEGSWFPSSVSNFFKKFHDNNLVVTNENFVEPAIQQAFQDAVRNNNWERAKDICQKHNVNANITFANGMSALHLAAKNSNDGEVIQFLIDRGAQVNSADVAGRTPYYFAESIFSSAVMASLVKAGADIKATDQSGRTGKDLYLSSHKESTPAVFNYNLTPTSTLNPSLVRFTPLGQQALPNDEISSLSLGGARVFDDVTTKEDDFAKNFPYLALVVDVAKEQK